MALRKEIQLRIVIVDDSHHDHFFIKESLKEFKNITFVSCYCGEDFMEYLIKKHADTKRLGTADIVILDINMPGLSGFDVFEKVKKHKLEEDTFFFVLSTNLTDHDLKKCDELKLDCHIKPFTIEKFNTLLQRVIQHSGKD